MKKIILFIVSSLFITSLYAQTKFQELSLTKALELAKSEKKLVFIDCYTSWCGPCKIMAKEVLPQKEVGDFLNELFVCVKYDMEEGEGPELAKKYKVDAYPTFLLLNADGDFCEYTKEDSCYDRIHDYEIVQYAVLHGNLTR